MCLSYGVDVTSTDTVVLVSREQGWWPSASRISRDAALSFIPEASLDHEPLTGSGSSEGTGSGGGKGSAGGKSPAGGTSSGGCGENGVVGSRGASTREAIRLEVSFYRALHQLLCACVLPTSIPDGEGVVRSKDGVDRSADPGISIAGVKVLPDTWAAVGDTVDAAVEATVGWLLERYRPRDGRRGNCIREASSDRAVEVRDCPLVLVDSCAAFPLSIGSTQRNPVVETVTVIIPRKLRATGPFHAIHCAAWPS